MVVNHYKGMKLAIHSLPFFLFFLNLRSILFSRQTFAKSHGGIFLVHFIGQLLKSDRRESTSIGPHESQVMRGCDHGTDRGVIAGSNF